jgi:hypothetical protein
MNRAPRTIVSYLEAGRQFVDFLARTGMPATAGRDPPRAHRGVHRRRARAALTVDGR